jgi:hypothetical protein
MVMLFHCFSIQNLLIGSISQTWKNAKRPLLFRKIFCEKCFVKNPSVFKCGYKIAKIFNVNFDLPLSN